MPGKRFDNCPASSSGYLFEEPDEDEYRSISERLLVSKKLGWRIARLGLIFWPLIFVAVAFAMLG